jgi:hypothetical protein
MMTDQTIDSVLKQKLKIEAAERKLRAERSKLNNLTKGLSGESGLVNFKGRIYNVSIGWGMFPTVKIDDLGAKESIAELVQ